MSETIQGKTIVLTGASSGIGEAGAMALAAKGAKMILVARREDELRRVCENINDAGGQASFVTADLSDAKSTEACAQKLLDMGRKIDVLINNAGRSIRRPITESFDRPHDFERTMQLNYLAAVRLSLALLPQMVERAGGQIINISSQSVQMPMPRFAAYVASKSALEGFSRSIAAELTGSGVAVTVINYPLVRTPMSQATKIYSKVPMLKAEEAAQWLVHAVEKRPARVATMSGKVWQASTSIMPGVTTNVTGRFMNYMANRLNKSKAS